MQLNLLALPAPDGAPLNCSVYVVRGKMEIQGLPGLPSAMVDNVESCGKKPVGLMSFEDYSRLKADRHPAGKLGFSRVICEEHRQKFST